MQVCSISIANVLKILQSCHLDNNDIALTSTSFGILHIRNTCIFVIYYFVHHFVNIFFGMPNNEWQGPKWTYLLNTAIFTHHWDSSAVLVCARFHYDRVDEQENIYTYILINFYWNLPYGTGALASPMAWGDHIGQVGILPERAIRTATKRAIQLLYCPLPWLMAPNMHT